MPSGDIVVTTCLHEEDLAHLKADNQMSKYAQYLGQLISLLDETTPTNWKMHRNERMKDIQYLGIT